MAFDSSIRVRQLNQTELSGFVYGVISLFPQINISGNIIPSGSGVFNIGSSTYPYAQIFANQLNIPSGSGINFGNTSFNAYTSGGYAYINVGGVSIASNQQSIYIQGPSGVAGPSGAIGPTGLSGIGITGINYNTSSHLLSFYLSNGGAPVTFNFAGLSGSTGTSVTGFYQSGSYIYPQFSNLQGIGFPIQLIAGPPGPPASIGLYFQQSGTGVFNTANFPTGTFPNQVIINPYYSPSGFPDITLMRGMAYTLDVSGLNTHTITSGDLAMLSFFFSGQSIPFKVGDRTNYYEDSRNTGYWRFAFFPSGTATGVYSSTSNPSLFTTAASESTNFSVYTTSLVNNPYRTNISFATSFGAATQYQYGFILYSLGQDTTTDFVLTGTSSSTGYAAVVGNAYFASQAGPIGPVGPVGASGSPGPSGLIGLPGLNGAAGPGIVSYTYSGNGNNIYIQFQLANGQTQPWIPLPQGGPSGASGAAGTLTNNFKGNFFTGTQYPNDAIVSLSGSSYINTGIVISGIYPPNAPWMTLSSGSIGPSGLSGQIGPSGKVGSLANLFSGNYSGIYSYPASTVVVLSGSSYLNTGISNISGVTPPSAPWQLIAQAGATGPIGPSGIPSTLRPQNFFSLVYGNGIGAASSGVLLDPTFFDMYSLQISSGASGNAAGVNPVAITISGNDFQTGQSIIIKIRNINVPQNDGLHSQLFNLQSVSVNNVNTNIKWPANAYSFPNSGTANIYTIIRFPQELGNEAFYGTYSNPYF